MNIPPPLVAYLIYFKEFKTEEQASNQLGKFYQEWDTTERELVSEFVSAASSMTEFECRRVHRTNDPILDAEIVRVKSCSKLYGQINKWLSELK